MAFVDNTATDVVVTYPRLSWRAIIAGWLVATAVAGLLYVAGLALGFAAFDATDLASTAKGVGIGTGIWFVLTWAAALFLGGMAASSVDNQVDHTMGALQGVAVWGLSLTATALWIALGLGHAAAGSAAMAAASHSNHADGGNGTRSSPAARPPKKWPSWTSRFTRRFEANATIRPSRPPCSPATTTQRGA